MKTTEMSITETKDLVYALACALNVAEIYRPIMVDLDELVRVADFLDSHGICGVGTATINGFEETWIKYHDGHVESYPYCSDVFVPECLWHGLEITCGCTSYPSVIEFAKVVDSDDVEEPT